MIYPLITLRSKCKTVDKQRLIDSLTPAAKLQIADVEVFANIDSTNTEALRRLKAGKEAGFLLVARAQSGGRGRRGRTWVSSLDAGLYMSLVLPFKNSIENLQALSLVTALAVHSGITKTYPISLQLKWPNDILAGNKKLAGILLERQQMDRNSAIVFGIGVNMALPDSARQEIDRPFTDVKTLSKMEVDAGSLCASISNQLVDDIERFCRDGFGQFTESWNELDRYKNEDIIIEMGNKKTIGKSLGVNDEGCLALQSAAGVEVISSGEIFPSLHPQQKD